MTDFFSYWPQILVGMFLLHDLRTCLSGLAEHEAILGVKVVSGMVLIGRTLVVCWCLHVGGFW
jgi:hypothetical protein